jgi:hypothetical protein
MNAVNDGDIFYLNENTSSNNTNINNNNRNNYRNNTSSNPAPPQLPEATTATTTAITNEEKTANIDMNFDDDSAVKINFDDDRFDETLPFGRLLITRILTCFSFTVCVIFFPLSY